MQLRSPVGPGPSSKTWPRWPLHFEQSTSVRIMPWLTSRSSSTWLSAAGCAKLGQPQPESNLASDCNSVCPQPAQGEAAGRCSCSYSPENGRSVAFSRSTAYCIGVSSRRHSASLFSIAPGIVLVSGMEPPCKLKPSIGGFRVAHQRRLFEVVVRKDLLQVLDLGDVVIRNIGI